MKTLPPGARAGKLWLETPLLYSSHLSQRLESNLAVYLKLENLQPPHSYKYRGLSLFVQYKLAAHGESLHIICASGGNAGLAAAAACQALGVKCTIYLPEGVAPATREYLQRLGADLVVAGSFFLEALRAAEAAVNIDPNAVLAPAYDDPLLWQGHASMIDEIQLQLPADAVKPEAIFCSVGGGGLLGGIIVGCRTVGWDDVPIITLETHGSNCFYQSIQANRNPSWTPPDNVTTRHDDDHDVKLAHLHRLTSKATSLGATEPSAEVVRMALDRTGGVKCVSIPDELAMQVAGSFVDDHKMLVELACSATLAPAYKGSLLSHLIPAPQASSERWRRLVFIVCGGFKISRSEMREYDEIVARDLAAGGDWTVLVDGAALNVEK
ncbi:hypothetical protein EWM64_g569 [Hericium alpestre]|uniref:L-serine ammonia-lyase n=1 Tax=Hericium alpestre TaxID=135208 RepID=A0A4Z0A8R0_9AGAM|nr:hypothetical protein EWM64_g569 [Hericium alpestre]